MPLHLLQHERIKKQKKNKFLITFVFDFDFECKKKIIVEKLQVKEVEEDL